MAVVLSGWDSPRNIARPRQASGFCQPSLWLSLCLRGRSAKSARRVRPGNGANVSWAEFFKLCINQMAADYPPA